MDISPELNDFRIFYLTNWNDPLILYKVASSDKWETQCLTKKRNTINLYQIQIPFSNPLEFSFQSKDQKLMDNNNDKNYQISKGGYYIIYDQEIIPISTHQNKKKVAFFTDLDGTLLGDDLALKEFNKFWLQNFFLDENKLLIYNTSRCLKEVYSLFQKNVLHPNLIISSLGSQILKYEGETNSYALDEEWNSRIYENWDQRIIIKEFGKLEYLKRFEYNEDDDPGVCYILKSEELEGKVEEINNFKITVEKKYNLKIHMVISGEGDTRFLDLLSSNAGKGKVVEYICKKMNFPIEDSYGFGDSLNDVGMLLICGKSFLVSNSHKCLIKWYHEIEKNTKNNQIQISPSNNAWALLEEARKLI